MLVIWIKRATVQKTPRKKHNTGQRYVMHVTYRKLWYQLIDRKLKKADLKRMTGLSATTLASMTADKTVSLNVLLRICEVLKCNLCDVVESVQDDDMGASGDLEGILHPNESPASQNQETARESFRHARV